MWRLLKVGPLGWRYGAWLSSVSLCCFVITEMSPPVRWPLPRLPAPLSDLSVSRRTLPHGVPWCTAAQPAAPQSPVGGVMWPPAAPGNDSGRRLSSLTPPAPRSVSSPSAVTRMRRRNRNTPPPGEAVLADSVERAECICIVSYTVLSRDPGRPWNVTIIPCQSLHFHFAMFLGPQLLHENDKFAILVQNQNNFEWVWP